jgi:hypothetical protein
MIWLFSWSILSSGDMTPCPVSLNLVNSNLTLYSNTSTACYISLTYYTENPAKIPGAEEIPFI